jgi:hypothetical protein
VVQSAARYVTVWPMLTIGPLEAPDRAAWQQLFAGYNEFYGLSGDPLYLSGDPL